MSTITTNLVALYGFQDRVQINPKSPIQWFDENADVVLYCKRTDAIPYGYWTEQGFKTEWPVMKLITSLEELYKATAQEDVEIMLRDQLQVAPETESGDSEVQVDE